MDKVDLALLKRVCEMPHTIPGVSRLRAELLLSIMSNTDPRILDRLQPVNILGPRPDIIYRRGGHQSLKPKLPNWQKVVRELRRGPLTDEEWIDLNVSATSIHGYIKQLSEKGYKIHKEELPSDPKRRNGGKKRIRYHLIEEPGGPK